MAKLNSATSGTFESSDIFIKLEPNGNNTVNINLESIVQKQFGAAINKLIFDTLEKYNIMGIDLTVIDKGALDCTISARLQTVLRRAGVEIE